MPLPEAQLYDLLFTDCVATHFCFCFSSFLHEIVCLPIGFEQALVAVPTNVLITIKINGMEDIVTGTSPEQVQYQ